MNQPIIPIEHLLLSNSQDDAYRRFEKWVKELEFKYMFGEKKLPRVKICKLNIEE